MTPTVISVEHLSKSYRLGQIGTGTLTNDLKVWWARTRGKPNPLLKIGQEDHGNIDGETLWALKDVSFTVEQGEVLGIIGRNGAGKSTLLKILSRVTAPTSGVVKVKGRIASLLEVGTGFHPELTGRENIYLNGAILGMTKQEIARKFDEIVDFAEIEEFIDTPVKRYSSGMYVRLAFAVAAHLESEILLVDEVLAVGDAEFQKKCLGKMGDVANKEGRTVLFVSHNMGSIQNLCNRTLLINQGKVTENGTTEDVISHYLSGIQAHIDSYSLAHRTDRKGTGDLKLIDFYMMNKLGQITSVAQSGDDLLFCFEYETRSGITCRNVDIGFSLHSITTDQTLCVFYSSYVGTIFDNIPRSGVFQCKLPKFPFSPGRYKVGARVVINGLEADWPQDGIGFIELEWGDFYGTGSEGFVGNNLYLLNGNWQVLPK